MEVLLPAKQLIDHTPHMETRNTTLRVAIHQLIVEEKLYRDPMLTRGHVIARLGVGKNRFVSVFQESFGTSFTEYVNQMRMQEALSLLHGTDLTITEVAEKTGFGTSRTFRRQFSSRYGLSPAAFRKHLADKLFE